MVSIFTLDGAKRCLKDVSNGSHPKAYIGDESVAKQEEVDELKGDGDRKQFIFVPSTAEVCGERGEWEREYSSNKLQNTREEPSFSFPNRWGRTCFPWNPTFRLPFSTISTDGFM